MFRKVTTFLGESLCHPEHFPGVSPDCHPDPFFRAWLLPAIIHSSLFAKRCITDPLTWNVANENLDVAQALEEAFRQAFRIESFLQRESSGQYDVIIVLTFFRKTKRDWFAKFTFRVGKKPIYCMTWEADDRFAKFLKTVLRPRRKVTGHTLIEEDGKIVAITSDSFPLVEFHLGSRVRANSRHPASGCEGVVTAILEPFKDGNTSDVIVVRWEDNVRRGDMKIKELELL